MKKLKSSIKALNPDITFVLFAIFTAIALAIRTYQLQYIFEPDTGFYYMEMKHSFTIPLLYAVVAASCVENTGADPAAVAALARSCGADFHGREYLDDK